MISHKNTRTSSLCQSGSFSIIFTSILGRGLIYSFLWFGRIKNTYLGFSSLIVKPASFIFSFSFCSTISSSTFHAPRIALRLRIKSATTSSLAANPVMVTVCPASFSDSIQMLYDIAVAMSVRVWIEALKEAGQTVTITGFAASDDVVADFMRSLKAILGAWNVELEIVEQKEKEKIKLAGFTIRLEKPK